MFFPQREIVYILAYISLQEETPVERSGTPGKTPKPTNKIRLTMHICQGINMASIFITCDDIINNQGDGRENEGERQVKQGVYVNTEIK